MWTHRSVRLGLFALLVLLATAIGLTTLLGQGAESISGLIATPAARPFVGALFAVGALLIVYRGRTDAEDRLLNFAGFLALVVAFVPTPGLICPAKSPDPLSSNGDSTCISSGEYKTEVLVSEISLIVMGLVVWLFSFLITRNDVVEAGRKHLPKAPTGAGRVTRGLVGFVGFVGRYANVVGVIVVVVVLGVMPFVHDRQGDWRHNAAAIAMFLFFVLVIGLVAAYELQDGAPFRDRARRFYWWFVGCIPVAAGLCIFFSHLSARHDWVLWLEVFGISEFAGFWGFETCRGWSPEASAETLTTTTGPATSGTPVPSS